MIRNAAFAGLVIAAVDYIVQRRRIHKEMMMSLQEVKEEHRQQEGNPQMKQEIRSQMMKVSRNRMLSSVSSADVVLVNPTHYAVALKYDSSRGAPEVVAKGAGAVAAAIRARAEEHAVPIVSDPPLTRTIYKACEIGQQIPAELYEAVAKVLAFIFGLRRRGFARLGGVHRIPVGTNADTPHLPMVPSVRVARRRARTEDHINSAQTAVYLNSEVVSADERKYAHEADLCDPAREGLTTRTRGVVKPNAIGQVGIPASIVAVIVIMVVPMPAVLIDFLLVCNITFAVVTLLSSMFVRRALDFSIFPSFLLIATLFRLALNISVTRLVLLNGDGGKVVEAFGHFVVGGSIVVGLVVFLILIVIQFVVITNGAGRVAEVAARFTLDAMPGKQMAIDADLNAGMIDEKQARARRKEISDEADFYGAMDGASKFVKGDAIAAIIIVLVNLLGGFSIGVIQKGMPIGEAITTYSLLTVGDGLVSQIPALLISMSAGLIVTRAATDDDLGTDLLAQFGQSQQILRIAGGAVLAMALVPGLPKFPFILVGSIVLYLATRVVPKIDISAESMDATAEAAAALAAPAPDSAEALSEEMRVEPLELELAFDLIDLVDTSRGGDLLDRVRALRTKACTRARRGDPAGAHPRQP